LSERESDAGGVQAVLFDKDGTLIDLHASWVGAGLATARELCRLAGVPQREAGLLAASGYQPEHGRLDPLGAWACGSTASLVRGWLQALGLDTGEQHTARWLRFMTAEAGARVTPLADLARVFDELATLGMRLGVATMDLEDSARTALAKLGLAQRVDFVCGCDSGHGEKPDPGMVLACCRALGLDPRQLAVVGDTPHDMRMARAAGAGRVVAVTSGAAGEQLLGPLADHVIPDVSHLPALFAS
jgi:phosphoglycolate phosphatase